MDINRIDVDYMDVDMLLSTLVSNFKKQKRDLHSSLKKEFLRKTGVVTARLQFSELQQIIKQAEKAELMHSGSAIPDPMVGWCGTISQIRAYIFSLLAGEDNDSSFGVNHLIAGLSRFGSDNPVPPVSTKCSLYGNSKAILTQLKDAAEKL